MSPQHAFPKEMEFFMDYFMMLSISKTAALNYMKMAKDELERI
jgi:hypothetical protein